MSDWMSAALAFALIVVPYFSVEGITCRDGYVKSYSISAGAYCAAGYKP